MRSGKDRKFRRNERKSGGKISRFFYSKILESIGNNLLYSGALGDSHGGSTVTFDRYDEPPQG